MSALPLRAPNRLVRGVVSVLANVAFAVVLLGAGPTDAGSPTPTGTIRPLPITAALKTAIRASFYRAYRADPREFSSDAGLPISAVLEQGFNDTAVLAGTTPAESSAWVIGAVCMLTPVACEDAGAFQVFYRTALTNSFVYLPGGLCDLPAPLVARWFPGGHYPLGIACLAGNLLVRRGGIRPGAWAALVPRAWTQVPYGAVHFGHCSTASAPRLNPSLCSSEGGDTDVDVWFNPAKTNERLTVITCRGGSCFPATNALSLRLVAPPGATVISRRGGWELAYSDRTGGSKRSPASEEVTTLLLATHSDGRPSYPVYTVSVELPATETDLATAIADTFATA